MRKENTDNMIMELNQTRHHSKGRDKSFKRQKPHTSIK